MAASSGGTLVQVTVDCNIFRGKTHVNPISRLLEPIANAIEHGRANRVDVVVERMLGELVFSVTEHDGAGMSAEDAEQAIRFGHHAAKHDAKTLQNYSHNGIGTKACLNFFSRLAIFSVQQREPGGRTYVLLLLDVADKHGDGQCQPARRVVWSDGSSGEPDWGADTCTEVCQELLYLPPAQRSVTAGVAAEFDKIGRTGTRMVYFGNEGREGTSEASKQFILDGPDVRVHPGALSSGVAVPGAQLNSTPLYVTSLRQRLRHFLATPLAELYLNGAKVELGGAQALFACMDETLAPATDILGLLGDGEEAVIDPSEVKLELDGFRGILRMGRSEKKRGHRRWGTELFGDHFGTTQDGGLVCWVNGALVPLGEDNLWKYGISFRGKKMRWLKPQSGGKWGMHVWGTIEMYPPAKETILDIGKERLMPAEGGEGTRAFLQKIGPSVS